MQTDKVENTLYSARMCGIKCVLYLDTENVTGSLLRISGIRLRR